METAEPVPSANKRILGQVIRLRCIACEMTKPVAHSRLVASHQLLECRGVPRSNGFGDELLIATLHHLVHGQNAARCDELLAWREFPEAEIGDTDNHGKRTDCKQRLPGVFFSDQQAERDETEADRNCDDATA